MHFSTIAAAIVSGASLVSAHFSVQYPYWRGDSFSTQWEYPCGGVNQSISDTNRTLWPLEGGALSFKPSHHWAQTYVNLGLGSNVTRLNVPLVEPFNQTGNGTFCFSHIAIPESIKSNITEGVKATLQIIQLTTSGGALYNCMDITFSSKAKGPGEGVCTNSTGVGAANLNYPDVVPETGSNTTCSPDSTKNAADSLKTSMGAMVVMVAAGVAVLMA